MARRSENFARKINNLVGGRLEVVVVDSGDCARMIRTSDQSERTSANAMRWHLPVYRTENAAQNNLFKRASQREF